MQSLPDHARAAIGRTLDHILPWRLSFLVLPLVPEVVWVSVALAVLALVVAFVALIAVVNVLTHGNFLTAGNLTNVLRQITYNAILAVGQTFVIITAGIDLSVGSLIELTGVVMADPS